jgi:hypothetical protein
MKKTAVLLFLLAAAALPAGLAAQALPDLKNQAGWKEKDKQDFLKFLKSGQQAPVTGQVKSVPGDNGGQSWAKPRKARYLTLALASNAVITVNDAGVKTTHTPSFGPELLVGGHLFSWIRYYGGVKYSRLYQERLDGRHSRLAHYEIPLGIELALIPLGTPQTRYVLLRAGVSTHYFSGSANKVDFNPALLGWHEAWNVGLGYEWQFANTRWRANLLAEGGRSFIKKNSPEFYQAGLKAGLAYTF